MRSVCLPSLIRIFRIVSSKTSPLCSLNLQQPKLRYPIVCSAAIKAKMDRKQPKNKKKYISFKQALPAFCEKCAPKKAQRKLQAPKEEKKMKK